VRFIRIIDPVLVQTGWVANLLAVAQLAKLITTRFTPILAFPSRGKGPLLSPLRGRVRVGVEF
jgi:hypothetical protein